jgi:glycosyltransferase involved in cell wall biosynthesis
MRRTVIHFCGSTEFGGTEQVMLTLLKGMDRRVWAPVLLYHESAGIRRLVDGARQDGLDCVAVPPVWRLKHAVTGLMPFVMALRRARPAVFHAHLSSAMGGKYALLAARIAGVPIVLATVHLYVNVGPGRRLSLSHRVATACVARYIAVSHSIAQSLRRRFGVPAAKLQVIHNGIPRRPMRRPPRDLRAALGAAPGQPIVLSVGRLDRQKGQRFLLEAAALYPGPLYVFAGDGPEHHELQGRARELGVQDRVRFLGFRTDVADLISVCDLFALPSLYEGLPLALLEALAGGKPVVASAIGGVEEVITHADTGLLVPSGDSRALADAIRTVLTDAALTRRMGKRGRELVEAEFTCDAMVNAVTQVYEDLLAQIALYGR